MLQTTLDLSKGGSQQHCTSLSYTLKADAANGMTNLPNLADSIDSLVDRDRLALIVQRIVRQAFPMHRFCLDCAHWLQGQSIEPYLSAASASCLKMPRRRWQAAAQTHSHTRSSLPHCHLQM